MLTEIINLIFYFKFLSELQLEGSFHQLNWRDPISDGGEQIFVFSKAVTPTLESNVAFYSMDTGGGGGVPWEFGRSVKLSTYLYLLLKLRIRGAVLPLFYSLAQLSTEKILPWSDWFVLFHRTAKKLEEKILAGHKRSNSAAIYASKLLLFPCLRWAIIWSPNGEGRTARQVLWWNSSDKMWR